MAELPQEFTAYTLQLMGEERFGRYLESFEEEAPVSIRLNPRKADGMTVAEGEPVAWCRNGYYLKQRPNFTMDPLLHAGCYYVQEAASMFLEQFIVHSYDLALDLCAAPGGKSTLLRSLLPDDCVLYSNEPVRNRASILVENVTKWGYGNHFVTNDYPKDYRKEKMKFDVILCDVPCSGEGMFRKDPATIGEWSPQNVEKCWRLQREIVDDAWVCLNPGGLLIYSTCTFNTKENEENVRYFLEQYEAELVAVDVKPEWNITGSLLEGFDGPVYRFIPGISRSEGLFMCGLRKKKTLPQPLPVREGNRMTPNGGKGKTASALKSSSALNTIYSPPSQGGAGGGSSVPLSYPQAIAYLRGEALRLPEDTPRGEVTVTFLGHPLGLVKNIGSRANNLYPKPWRIRTTHIPQEYENVLKSKQ